MRPDSDVLIIGAGTSGLALAHELIKCGVQPRIVEAETQIAERWRRRHPGLRLNTHKFLSYLPGRKFDRSAAGFPTRDEFITYLEDYERALGVPVEYGVRVNRIKRHGAHWIAESSAGQLSAHNLIIATGPDNTPVIPDWPGAETFSGRIIHSADFGRASSYDGMNILLVGAGNSSVDIANHLNTSSPRTVWMSVRGGSTVTPQYILGFPTHLLTPLMRPLPTAAVDFCVQLISRSVCGDLTKFGMPAPKLGALSRLNADGTAPAIDRGFSDMLKKGRISIVPEIERFEDRHVHLQDGQILEPDLVVCGTGYRSGLHAMAGDLGVLDEGGSPLFCADQRSEAQPGLWFFGFRNSLWGNLNERRHEAARLAKAISLHRKK